MEVSAFPPTHLPFLEGTMPPISWKDRVQDYLRAALAADSQYFGIGMEIPVVLLDQAMNILVRNHVKDPENSDSWDHLLPSFTTQDRYGLNGQERQTLRMLRSWRNNAIHALTPDEGLFPPLYPWAKDVNVLKNGDPVAEELGRKMRKLVDWIWVAVACSERSGVPLLPESLAKQDEFPSMGLLEAATLKCYEPSESLIRCRRLDVVRQAQRQTGQAITEVFSNSERYPQIDLHDQRGSPLERTAVVTAGGLMMAEAQSWVRYHVDAVAYPFGYGEKARRLALRVRFRGRLWPYADFLWSDFPWEAKVNDTPDLPASDPLQVW